MRTRFESASARSIVFVGRCLLLRPALLSGLSNAASVREETGNIYFVADDGTPHQLTSLHADTAPVISPDGQWADEPVHNHYFNEGGFKFDRQDCQLLHSGRMISENLYRHGA